MSWLTRSLTRYARRYLVGPEQKWVFQPPPTDWKPPAIARTSIYLHVPFCRHCCPYCPYTKVPYDPELIAPYTRAAKAEVDRWADSIGSAEITSIYIGGGTPTLAMDSVGSVLEHVRKRFRLVGDVCIEANPADVDTETVRGLKDMGISMVSLGVQSFKPENLALLGRDYKPSASENALELLAGSGFSSVNADIMFALPGQTREDLIEDLSRVVELGADQVTTYPLFTFPYTSVGEHLRLSSLRMPRLHTRKEHYSSISRWFAKRGFERVSVWGFKSGTVPRYSSVTRDGYIGIGPGAGSHLPDCFVLNTFDLESWIEAAENEDLTTALHLPFMAELSGWWWLYWRFYDGCIQMSDLNEMLSKDSGKAHRLLKAIERHGWAVRNGDSLVLTERGAFWLHLVQNYFALHYVNTIWTRARLESWPRAIQF